MGQRSACFWRTAEGRHAHGCARRLPMMIFRNYPSKEMPITKFKHILTWCLIASASLHAMCQPKEIATDKFQELPLGSIQPKGWLRQQLQIMASGSSGHLDEVHPKIGHDNGWLGGKGDGW